MFQQSARILKKSQYVIPNTQIYRHKLDINESQFPASDRVLQAIANAAQLPPQLYPDQDKTYNELLLKISNYVDCAPSEIILTSGSDSALKYLCDAYAEPGVVIAVPTYPHFLTYAETLTDNVVYVEINTDDSSSMITLKIIDATKSKNCNLCYLVSPNMPIGYVLEINDVENCLRSCPSTMFIVDEAYIEFGGKTVSSLLNYDNLTIVRTFSKAFGLASLRIGYMVSKLSNTEYVRRIVNDKAVTTVAIAAANAAMDDLQYYLNQAAECEKSKDILRQKLPFILGDQIYDFRVNGGVYYLIFAKSPVDICTVFAKHGIYIRDKSSDIPGAIRIMIGREDQNEEVRRLIMMINLPYIIKQSTCIFDLDNTLRKYSKNSNPLFDGAKLLNDLDCLICTNNSTYTPTDISKYLSANGVNLEASKILSPISRFKQISDNLDCRFTVIGRVGSYFSENKLFTPFNECTADAIGVIFIACDYILSSPDYIKLCKLVCITHVKIYYAYSSLYTTLNDCADCEEFGEQLIPDVGWLINSLTQISSQMGVDNEFISLEKDNFKLDNFKPNDVNFKLKPTFMIGDSDSDMRFAKLNEFYFIRVGCESNCYDFDNGEFRIHSLSDLMM